MTKPSDHRVTEDASRYGGLEALAWIDFKQAEPTLTGLESSDHVLETRLTLIVDVVPEQLEQLQKDEK
ncbi:hypothetical protein AB0L41_21200 [Amycolatopsis mediterranei]|uniref:hypothetical protein n=1 Tax=Amycolatopsis mediterranei TaxID=33910 RepID=UPI003438C895